MDYAATTAVSAWAYLDSSSSLVKAAAVCGLSAASTAAIVVGVAMFRPRSVIPWLLIAAMQLIWTVARSFWQAQIISTGFTPASDSHINWAFLSGYPLIAAALLLLLLRRSWWGPSKS